MSCRCVQWTLLVAPNSEAQTQLCVLLVTDMQFAGTPDGMDVTLCSRKTSPRDLSHYLDR
jgi:hypothetical protein